MSQRDTRIVEMQFDNRKFERNIAKSQKSLEDFKKELDFDETSKGLTKFSSGLNKISFDNLIGNVQKLTDKFTGLGDAGEWVLSRIRSGIESTALQLESFVKSFTSMQIKVGQGKYDALNKAVQTIVAAGKYTEDQAYSVFERVMQYTDQTSASFENMVNAISQFTAVGQGLGDSEKALEGIFNMVSKAGQGAAQADAAFSIFSKAMGAGYLSYQNWLSLNQTAHIVTEDFRKTILETAVAVGDLTKKDDKYYTKAANGMKSVEVTAENLEQTLNKKWVSKKTMMALFDKYYFAKLTGATAEELDSFAGVAYQSAQRALTFVDALNAIKESVSSGWMESFRIILGKVSDAMEFFTNLCDRVIEGLSGIAEARNQILRAWAESGGRAALIDTILGDYGKEVKTGAYGLLDLFGDVGSMISKGFWDMTKIFASGGDRLLWDQPGYKEAWLGVHLKHLTEQIRDFIKSVKDFFNEEIVVNGQVTTRLEMIHKIIDGIVGILVIGWQILLGVIHFVVGLKQKLQPSIDAIVGVFAAIGEAIYDTAQENQDNKTIIGFFDDLLNSITPLTDAINFLITSIASLVIQFIKWGKESGFFATVFELVGKALTFIARVISAVGGPLITFFGDIFQIIQDLFTEGFTKESMKKAGQKLAAAFHEMLKALAENIPDSLSGLRDAIKDLFGLWDDDTDRSGTFFTKIRKNIESGFGGIISFVKGLIEGFRNMNFHDLFSINGIFGIAYKALNEVAGWFKGVNLYGVIMAFLGVATLWSLFRLISNAKKAVKGVKDFFTNLSDTLSNGIHFRSERYGDYILNLAKGLALLTACVVVLGTLDLRVLAQGLIALGAVMLAVWLFQKALKKSFKDQKFGDYIGMSTQLIALGAFITLVAGAVAIIAIALIPITAMGWEAMARALTLLVVILTALGTFTYLMTKAIQKLAGENKHGKTDTKELLKIAATMLIMSTAITILAAGIGALSIALVPLTLTGWEGLARAMTALVIMLAAIGGFMLIVFKILKKWSGGSTSDLSKFGMVMLEVAGGIALLAVGIGLLSVALVPLALMSWNGWARAMAGLGVILLELTGFIKLIQMMSKDQEKVTAQVKGLASLAIAIGILVLALVPLALIKWEGLAKMAVGLTFVLLEIVGMVWILKRMGRGTDTNVKIIGLAGLVFSIGLLVIALIPLANMDLAHLIQGVAALAVVMLELVAFVKIMMKMTNGAGANIKVAGIIGLIISVIGLAWAVTILGNMDTGKMVQGIAGIAVVMLELIAFIKIIGKTKSALKTAAVALALMAGIVVAAIGISFALNEVRDIKWEVITAFMGGLAVLIIAVAAAIKILSGVELVAGLKAIVLLAAAVGLLSLVLALVIPLLIGSLGSSLTDLVSKLELMATMFTGFTQKMGGISDEEMDATENVIIRIIAIFTVIKDLADFKGVLDRFYSNVYDLVLSLDLFYNNTADLASPDDNNAFKLVAKLREIQADVSKLEFGDVFTKVFGLIAALSVFDGIGTDMSDPENSKPLKMIQALADKASGIETLNRLNINNLVNNLSNLGGAMALYAAGASKVTGIELDELPDVTTAVGFLNQVISSLVDESGNVEIQLPKLPPEKELNDFGTQLSTLALALEGFISASSGWTDDTSKATDLLDFLSGDLKDRLKKDNLDVTKAFSDNDIETSDLQQFSTDISWLATALKNFVKNAQGASSEDVTKAVGILDTLVSLEERLTDNRFKSTLQAFDDAGVHKTELSQFGEDITQLGQSLKLFAENTYMDREHELKVQSAINSMKIISGLQNSLPKVEGVVQWFIGHNMTLDQFAEGLTALGAGFRNLVSYADVSGDSADILKNVVQFMTAIVELYDNLTKFMGDIIETNGKNVTDTEYRERLTDTVESTTWILRDILAVFDGYEDVMSEFTGKRPIANNLIDDILYMFSNIGSAIDQFEKDYGVDIDFNKVTGMVNSLAALLNYSDTIVRLGLNAKFNPENFTTPGIEVVSGIASGISGASYLVSDACYNLGVEARNAFLEAIDAASPSRDFYQYGLWITQGVEEGVETGTSGVKDSVHKAGDVTIEEIQDLAEFLEEAYSEPAKAIENTVNQSMFEKFEKFIHEFNQDAADDSGIKDTTEDLSDFADVLDVPSENMDTVTDFLQGIGTKTELKETTEDLSDFANEWDSFWDQPFDDNADGSLKRFREDAITGATNVISTIASLISEGIDPNPTITPVLDLTNMEVGIQQMHNMLANAGTVSGTGRANWVAQNFVPKNAEKGAVNQNGSDFGGLYNRMAQMQASIDGLGTKIANMHLVLDTGVVAGGIVDKVDTMLGRRTFYERRKG